MTKQYYVTRVEHDDGTWNAQREYMGLDSYGNPGWFAHKDHSMRMTKHVAALWAFTLEFREPGYGFGIEEV